MNKALRGVSEEIAQSLLQGLIGQASEETPDSDQTEEEVSGEPVQPLARKPSAGPVKSGDAGTELNERLANLESRFERIEEKLGAALRRDGTASYPNLKYRKPKYQNVDSLLNYIENKDDDSGVKLVIMNFND